MYSFILYIHYTSVSYWNMSIFFIYSFPFFLGEDLAIGARREIREETGIDSKIDEFIGIKFRRGGYFKASTSVWVMYKMTALNTDISNFILRI